MAEENLSPVVETAPYLDVVRAYDKQAAKWRRQAEKIIRRYLDERTDQQTSRLRYNILWANVETLKPAIYAKTPKPEVERRFLDKDPVGRVASDVLERCLDYYLSATPFGSTMRQARTDYLLTGRGVSWVRYVPQWKDVAPQITEDTSATDDEDGDKEAPIPQIAWEEVVSDYVHWKDFGHSIARTWEEVDCVWRIVYMTRAQMKKRGFADWKTVPLDYTDKEHKDAETEVGKKAAVYELWDKGKRQVFWFTKSHPRFLDKRDDFLKLDRFFPCSQPIYATLANESLIPIPDYVEYQDQAQELDELTARIGALQKAIKAAGVYDASQPVLDRLLSEGTVNKLLPVDSWAALAEKGGIKGAVDLLPMEEIAKTLLMLYEAREKVKQDLYEVTGMADIIRGATKASETATAQQIKNNYITLRLSEKQREMQRFARNTIEIMGNVICHHFQDETIKTVSGVRLLTAAEKAQIQQYPTIAQRMQQVGMQPPPPPSPDVLELMEEPAWEDVLGLLRKDPDRSFRIDIETDSTIEMDAQQERDEAMQFLTAVGGFFKESVNLPPYLAPLAGSMLEFGVRKWRVGRSLEGVIAKTVEDMEKQAAQPQQQAPDPKLIEVQQDGQLRQAEMQGAQQLEQAKLQATGQIEQAKIAATQQAEAAKIAAHREIAQINAQVEQYKAQCAHDLEMAKLNAQQQFDQWKVQEDNRTKIEVAEIAAGASIQTSQIAAAQAGVDPDDIDEATGKVARLKPQEIMQAHSEALERISQNHAEAMQGIGKALSSQPDIGKALEPHAKAMTLAVENIGDLVKEMRKPRKVKRGADGKIEGVE